MDQYRQIKPINLVENGVNYNRPMDISQPIDAYFARIDDCIQYALDGKTPYTSKTDHNHCPTCNTEDRMIQGWDQSLEGKRSGRSSMGKL
eukprot:3406156-Ditylum_brightwellii.AAC.1